MGEESEAIVGNRRGNTGAKRSKCKLDLGIE